MPSGVPSGYRNTQLQNYTPQQMQLLNSLLGGVQQGGGLQKGLGFLGGLAGGDESSFNELEAPSRAKFQGNIGQLANRFAGLGAIGSSSFQNALGGAANNFEQGLASQRAGYRRQAIQDLLGHSESLLGQRPFENVLTSKPQSFGASFGAALPGLLGLLF